MLRLIVYEGDPDQSQTMGGRLQSVARDDADFGRRPVSSDAHLFGALNSCHALIGGMIPWVRP